MTAEACLAKILPADVCLNYIEVGVLRARNLVALAEMFPLMRLTGVDSYKAYTDPAHGNYLVSAELSAFNHERALKAIAECRHKDRINLVIADSTEFAAAAADESFDVVFLDKGFDTPGQAQDICDWYSKVKPGGLFCGHDAWTPQIWEGVLQGLRSVGVDSPPQVIDNEVWYIRKQ